MKRFTALVLAITATLAPFASASLAADIWPTGPITIISTYKEGGALDMVLRSTAPSLEKELGVPVIVQAMPGGNTIVGTMEYFKRPADGNTLYATIQPAISYAHKILKNKHNLEEFDWINVQEIDYNSFLVPKDSPFKSIEDAIEFAKANPGKLRMGMMTVTSSCGVGGKLFNNLLNLDVKEVIYESGATLRPAVLGGHVDLAVISAYADFIVFGEDGGVRCLAYMSDKKLDDIWKDATPLNDVTVPKYGVTFPEIGDQRLLGVRKEFRQKYPERWNKLLEAYQRALFRPEMDQRYALTPSLRQLNSPERSLELIRGYDKLLDDYKSLFQTK